MNSRNSIRHKVVKRFLIISMSAIFSVGIVAAISIFYLRQSAINISGLLGDLAAYDSEYALEVQTKEMLRSLSRNKAEISNYKLKTRENFINMMAAYATEIMSEPDKYKPLLISPPDPSNKGIVTAQLQLAESVRYEDVSDEIALISNSQLLFNVIVEENPNIKMAYLGSETGVSITSDRDSDLKTNTFDPRERPWYKLAKHNNKLIWTDIYDDVNGRGLAITCAAPYYDSDGNIKGVVGIDGLLSDLTGEILGEKIGETGYAFVLNEYGHTIVSPVISNDPGVKIITSNLLESQNEGLRNAANKMIAGERGFGTINIADSDFFIAYEPFDTLPWSMATVISTEEALKMAEESQENITDLKNSALSKIDSGVLVIAFVFLLLVAVIAAAVVFFAGQMGSKLTEPIIALTKGAEIIGGGNLTHRFEVCTNDEIGTLALTFNKMVGDIKTITGEKERISAELNIATKIQSSMLPSIFPAFPERKEFDIYASMLPAKEVGGDFYDFFLIDENRLAVIIADVSGKGVPAALFMVIAKTLIKNNAQNGKSPKEVFEAVNNLLCANNDAQMFVTAFMGYLDIRSGRFCFVNAGHNPPFISRGGSGFERLKTKYGLVLAGLENIAYDDEEAYLAPGDVILLYTDGATDAVNKSDNMLGESGLLEIANVFKNNASKEMLLSIKREIDMFADGADQADDITMLALRIEGGA